VNPERVPADELTLDEASAVDASVRRRRRPSGEPPPLPRPVSTSTRWFGAACAAGAALSVALMTNRGTRVITGLDLAVTRWFAAARSDAATEAFDLIASLGSTTTFRLIAWTTLVVLLATRRFQHLFAALALLLVVPVLGATLQAQVGRMRPAGVPIIGEWDGYAYPSLPITDIALVLTIGVVVLVPPNRWRRLVGRLAAAFVVLVLTARLYTGVDHPSDAAAGIVLGAALPLVALRLLTPDETFPVRYRRGVRAHLDVGGRRGEAIRRALASQLGLVIIAVEPFALTASAGSTPLRLTTDSGEVLFGKLYAANHMRSDRWYKLARTIRYGRLEDERPFNSVRRLVQYEDHMLRVFRDAGVPTADTHGIVEITPDREYLLVTDLIPESVQMDHLDVAAAQDVDAIVDQSLQIVRTLWDAGLAHRDIKPANLLVSNDGRVFLIDVAFAQIRPSPWREAVDLANMMLTLALWVPADRVYERATLLFTPDEIGEAFAATRAVTVPSQLRSLLRAQTRDLEGTFRSLAPPRDPVAIQRWSLRRIGLTAAVAVGAIVAVSLMLANLRLAGLL
jgi:tRNA A-37 threonylcarbamoyl transferase component Bud32/membrane-associated phospholipid phosphatase